MSIIPPKYCIIVLLTGSSLRTNHSFPMGMFKYTSIFLKLKSFLTTNSYSFCIDSGNSIKRLYACVPGNLYEDRCSIKMCTLMLELYVNVRVHNEIFGWRPVHPTASILEVLCPSNRVLGPSKSSSFHFQLRNVPLCPYIIH